MGIWTDSYLIVGYILPKDYFGEMKDSYNYEMDISDLAEQLNCDYIRFNTGYDTPSIYALVPKGYKTQEPLSEEQFLKVLEEAKKIAQRSSKELPKLVIQSVYYIG